MHEPSAARSRLNTPGRLLHWLSRKPELKALNQPGNTPRIHFESVSLTQACE
jgi:hypothetical protein